MVESVAPKPQVAVRNTFREQSSPLSSFEFFARTGEYEDHDGHNRIPIQKEGVLGERRVRLPDESILIRQRS